MGRTFVQTKEELEVSMFRVKSKIDSLHDKLDVLSINKAVFKYSEIVHIQRLIKLETEKWNDIWRMIHIIEKRQKRARGNQWKF